MTFDLKRVQAVFLAAAETADPEARAAILDRECGTDKELRQRIEALLKAHDMPASILEEPSLGENLGLRNERQKSLNETRAEEDGAADDDPEALDFLSPSTATGSLGRLGHYEILEVLGRGGFGIVLRAFDEILQRIVAVKVLAPVLAATSAPRKRFLREARAAAKVRHINIVQVYAVEELPLPYLVMEFIPGETLQQRLDRDGPLEIPEIIALGAQIADGLAAAHDKGLIHRDIKPANILLEEGSNPQVKITDFGLARTADEATLTQSGIVAGTPLFMSPEQANGEKLDHRADLFSLGSVLYTMCSGRPPFRAPGTLAILNRVAKDTPRPIPEIIPEVPNWLCDLISQLHAKKPEERIASAREVAEGLREGSTRPAQPTSTARRAGERPPPGPHGGPTPSAPLAHRFPLRRGAIAAAVLAMGVFSLGFTEATGVTNVRSTVIRLFSPEGALVVEVSDPAVSVTIEGSELVITGAGAKEIRLKPGNYQVEARKDGQVVSREWVTVTNKGRQVVRITQEALAKENSTQDSWERTVAAMPAEEQVKAVTARLRELNPGFEGPLVPHLEDGKVKGLEFATDSVTDLSPLRALLTLQSLKCSSMNPSRNLIDLSPLRGLPLTHLNCVNTYVHDLSPLKGMALRELRCDHTRVTDLSPLQGMPLVVLSCAYTKVEDLAPLKGMALTFGGFNPTEVADLTPLQGMPLVSLGVGNRVTDLSPLRGMRLEHLDCSYSGVSDLSPLKGMPLTQFTCEQTQITDISLLSEMKTLRRLSCNDLVANLKPLQGLPLEYLHAGPLVTDLSPLKGMPLDKLEFKSFQAGRDAAVLRAIPTLKTINDKPAAQFWREVDGEHPKP